VTISVNAPLLPGDYNDDNVVDAADYVVWRKTLGMTGVPAYSGADGNGDTTIDQDDFQVWRTHFGQTLSPPGHGSGAAANAFSQSTLEVAGKTAVPAPSEMTEGPVEAGFDAVRETGLAMLAPRAVRHDFVSRPRVCVNISRVAEPAADNLLLLLAIDRLTHSPWQTAAVFDDRGSDNPHANDAESQGLSAELLELALKEQ
jgi:hypothetical protein